MVVKLDKAQLKGVAAAGADVQRAEQIVRQALQQLEAARVEKDAIYRAVGLDPNVNYTIAEDGTFTALAPEKPEAPAPQNRAERRRAGKKAPALPTPITRHQPHQDAPQAQESQEVAS